MDSKIAARSEQIVDRFYTGCENGGAGIGKSACAENLFDEQAEATLCGWQHPGFAGELGKFDVASSSPRTLRARCHEIGIFVESLEADPIFIESADFSQDQQIEVALFEIAYKRLGASGRDVKHHARVATVEPVHDRRNETRSEWMGTADPHLANPGIGQEFDVLHTLPQLIERGIAAAEHGAPICRKLDTTRISLQQTNAEGVLEFADRARDDGMGYGQLACRLGHAAELCDGDKDMQIAQLDPAAVVVRRLELGSDVADLEHGPTSEQKRLREAKLAGE